MPHPTDLLPHQAAGVEHLRRAGRSFLADEPGLGKTRTALEAAEGRTLVVAPAMLEDVWADEHKRWRPDLDLDLTFYTSLCQRVKTERGGMSVLPKLRPEWRGRYDTVIYDEAHYLKGRALARNGTKWIQAAHQVQAERCYLLTGTPMPNWAHEMYEPLRFVHRPVPPELTSYWRWVGEWFKMSYNPHHRGPGSAYTIPTELVKGVTWDDFARDACQLEGRWIRHLRDECLELPPLTHQTVRVRMGPKQRKAYDDFRRDMYAMIEDEELIAWSEGGLWTRLLQLSTGLELLTEASGSAKLDALDEIMRERKGSPTLIFGLFRRTVDLVKDRMLALGLDAVSVHGGHGKADRLANIKRFQKGRADVLVGTAATLSEGLTLVQADTVIFVERSPRPSTNEQAVRRIHRMGQTRPCLAIDLVTVNSVDSGLVELLTDKTDQQAAALRAFDLLAAS